MESQVLNELKKFTEKYGFEGALGIINNMPDDSTERKLIEDLSSKINGISDSASGDELKNQVLSAIDGLSGIDEELSSTLSNTINSQSSDTSKSDYVEILEEIVNTYIEFRLKTNISSILESINGDVCTDISENEKIDEDTKSSLIDNSKEELNKTTGVIWKCDSIDEEGLEAVQAFLEYEEALIKEYTNRKAKRLIGTMSGSFKTVFISSVLACVILGTGVTVYLANRNSKKTNNTGNKTVPTPSASSVTPTPTVMPTSTPVVTPTVAPTPAITDEQVEKVAEEVYSTWSQITNVYSVKDIEEIIKVLNGLDSSITIDDADDVIQDILSQAVVPSVNNILMGKSYDPKAVNVSGLLLEPSAKVSTMENILNYAIAFNNLNVTAKSALTEEVSAFEDSELESMSAASRIIWIRLAEAVNAIHGTLGENYCIEINGDYYFHRDYLDSGIYEDEIAKAKQELNGKTI